MRENLALADLVLELLDARLPASSRDPGLDRLLRGRARLVVLNKADLADPHVTREWLSWLADHGQPAVAFNATSPHGVHRLLTAVRKHAGRPRTGRALRLMVVGIPNVGKSSLLNRLAGRARAATGDFPGITRGKQWITLAPGLELLDLPGVLPPRPPRGEAGYRLAASGALREGVFDAEEVAAWLLAWLAARSSGRRGLGQAYGEGVLTAASMLEAVGRVRGCLGSGGEVDRLRAAALVLRDFRAGRLGRHSLERPPGRDGA